MKKKNLALIISAIVLFLIGAILLILALALNGTDFSKWLTSNYGITIFISIGLYLILIIGYLIKDKISKI